MAEDCLNCQGQGQGLGTRGQVLKDTSLVFVIIKQHVSA